MVIPTLEGSVPWLSREQVAEVDRVMAAQLGIGLAQVTEIAGRQLAHLLRVRFLAADPRGRRITVLVGKGSTAAGALVCARRLAGWGARVRVLTSHADSDLSAEAFHELTTARQLRVQVVPGETAEGGDGEVVVDGLTGTSLRGAPRGTVRELIRWANRQPAPVVALDLPSGLDADGGPLHDPTIRAEATLTLALPKLGLRSPGAEVFVGDLYLADVGVPPEALARPPLGLEVGPIFARDEILRIEV